MALAARARIDFNDRVAALRAVGQELGLPAASIPAKTMANSHRNYLKWINIYRASQGLGLLPSLDYTGFTAALNVILASSGATTRPENTVPPVISTVAVLPYVVGNTFTSTTGTWLNTSGISYAYQWQRNGTNIASATTSSYNLVSADLGGKTLTCNVTATNAGGASTPIASNGIFIA